MPLQTATISGQLLRPDLSAGAMSVTIHAVSDGARLAYNGKVIAGKVAVNIHRDGTAKVTLPLIPQTGLTPAGALWRITWKSGGDVAKFDFTLAGDTTWDDLVDVSNIPITSSLLADAVAARDAAVAAAAGVSAAVAAISRSRPVPAIDVFGDSISVLCGGPIPVAPPSGSTYPAYQSPQARGYINHALTLLGHRARFGTNFGIGGQTSQAILARIADPLASPSPMIVVYAGINDVGQGRTATSIKQDLLSIYSQLQTAGKVVIAATIGSSLTIAGAAVTNAGGTAIGATSFTTNAAPTAGDVLILDPGNGQQETVTVSSVTGSGPYTVNFTGTPATKTHALGAIYRNTTKLALLHDVNQWIIDYCRGRYVNPTTGTTVVAAGPTGIYLVDWHTPVADPATGQPYGCLDAAGAIYNSTTNPVATLLDGTHPGQDLAHRMGHALALVLDRLVPPLPIRNGDNSEVANLLTNGRAVGNSSGLATGFTLTATAGAITATPSKVARADGVPGEAQQVAVGPGNTGQGSLLVGDVSGLVFNGTDAYVLEVTFETDDDLVLQAAPLAGGAVPLRAQLFFRDAGGVVAAGYSHFTASGSDGAGTLWDAAGVFRTETVVPPATATRVQAMVLFGGVDTGTFRVKEARVRKVF